MSEPSKPFFPGANAGQRKAALREAHRRVDLAARERSAELNLDGLGLTTVPAQVNQMTWLRSLSLSRNSLASVPTAIRELTGLGHLDLSANRLTTLVPWIGELASLEVLDLTDNELTTLPAELGSLTALRYLGLADNRLIELPEALKQLPQPERLRLHLHGNPALGLPSELLGPRRDDAVSTMSSHATAAAVLNVYFRTQAHERPLNEAKLILVGFGEVGKTSIVNRLVHRRFNLQERKTDGIAITRWPIPLNGVEEVKLHVWDFGGQEIMHATHQFFLTQRSLYLLVLNGRRGRQQLDATYWLSLIASRAQDSPVIVVRNKIREDPCELDGTALRASFPMVRAIIDTDCADEPEPVGIAELEAAIKREVDALPELRARFPAAWFAIKDRLADMPEDYLTIDQYRQLCDKHGEVAPDAQDTLARFLHCLGIALNFRDDPQWLLHSTHVLKPQWVTDGVYTILTHDMLGGQKGELHTADLGIMLDRRRYPRERHEFLLQLMRRFELTFPFPEQQDHYLVPERLGWEPVADAAEFDPLVCLNFEYHYPFLPEGLIPRFIVRSHILSAQQERWRSGVILRLQGNRALVVGDSPRNLVRIAIDGPIAGRRRLLSVIRHDLEYIHRSYRFQPTAKVPLPGNPSVAMSYDDLQIFERDGITDLPAVVDGQALRLDVRRLLDGVDLPSARAEGRRERKAISVFVSYAHKDETLREELETQLKLLQHTGMLDAWNDRRIRPGENWENQIDDNLQRADVVLLLISADFMASDYCLKEMEIALQRQRSGSVAVVPIIVRHCNWRHLPVSVNQALPKNGNAIESAGYGKGERDAAWATVEEGIRSIVATMVGASR